jgi:hypothetical protein
MSVSYLTHGDILLIYERNRNASRELIVDEEVERGVDGVIGEAPHVLVDGKGEIMSLIALGEIAVALFGCCSSCIEGADIEPSICGIMAGSSCRSIDPGKSILVAKESEIEA